MKRTKKQYPEDFKTIFGFSTISWVQGFATMVYAIFMQFLTDYSGIDAAIGQVGFAAAFGTVILTLTRVVDAIDDPLQAWIMDRSKECKFGKYRRFTLVSVFLIGIGTIVMFTLPDFIKSNGVALFVWIMAGYILFEMGCAFNGVGPMVQKATTDARIRTKITSCVRFAIIIAVLPATFMIPIATAVNTGIGDMGKSFTLACVVITIISCLISFLGVVLTKEPYHGHIQTETEEEKLKIKDVWEMLKHNKPMWVHNIGFFIGNMSFSVTSAVLVYFLKWFYCADMATGAVDEIQYATIYGLYSACALIPAFLTPFIAGFVVKIAGSIDRAMRVTCLFSGIPYGIMFVLYLCGVLQSDPMVFIVLAFLAGIPANVATITEMLVTSECADYVEYTTGKNMVALTTAVNNVLQKTQSAVAVMIPGIVLMAVGYSVNSSTGAYAGDLTKLPDMVHGLTLIITLVPFVVSALSWAVYKFFYPITPEFRKKMTEELDARRAEAQKSFEA